MDALRTGDLAGFAGLLADDAVFVDSHGAADKALVVRNTAEFRLQDYSIEDVRFVPLSASSGLISYRVSETGTSHGRQFAAHVFVSAVWVERNGSWVCVFSQETAVK